MKIMTNLTVLALAGFAFTLTSQAELKGGERLAQRPAPAAASAGFEAMSCPGCKDATVNVPDINAKGGSVLVAGGIPVKAVATHQCASCASVTAKTGGGKHSPYTVKHICAAGVANSCASVK
jgi:ribosomal protein S27E